MPKYELEEKKDELEEKTEEIKVTEDLPVDEPIVTPPVNEPIAIHDGVGS